jgi:hypothetical protein
MLKIHKLHCFLFSISIVFVIGCIPAQKTPNSPLRETPVPPVATTLPVPSVSPTIFLSPTPVVATQPPVPTQTAAPGNAASILLPTLTAYPPTKPSLLPEREVIPFLADLNGSTPTFLTYTPSMPHVNAGFYDGELLYVLGSAWKSKSSWFPDSIFAYNFKTGVTSLVTSSVLGQKGVVGTLAASQEWLSWDTHYENGSGWQLFARNLKTGKEILVDRQEDTNYNSLRGPYTSISGSLLVWSTVRKNAAGEMKGTVMLIDLDKGVKRILIEDPSYFFGFVGIDNGQVVWSKGQFDSDEVNVYLHDLKTGKTTQLTDDDRSYQPQIRGDWVVWRHGFGQIGPISILNLKSGERIRLNTEGDFLRIGDGLVLWWTYLKTNAYVYDLRKNILYPVFDSYDFQPPLYIYGRSIVAETVPEQGTAKNQLIVQLFP